MHLPWMLTEYWHRIGEFSIHLIIHGLALKHTAWDLRHYTLSQPLLISMLNRDGLKVFVAVFGIPSLSSLFTDLH